MYSWVPGAASSWTAAVPWQNELGLEGSPQRIKRNQQEKHKAKTQANEKYTTLTAVVALNMTAVGEDRRREN